MSLRARRMFLLLKPLRRFRRSFVPATSISDCGPAALATIARHYGVRVTVWRMHELARTDLQGTDIESLRGAAEKLGFEAVAGSLQRQALEIIQLPLIAHLDDRGTGHYVVVHQASADDVVVADPARGVKCMRREDFDQRWTGAVLLLKPTPQLGDRFNENHLVLDLLQLTRQEKPLLVTSAWLAVMLSGLAYGLSVFVKVVIDQVIPKANSSLLQIIGIGLGVVIVTRTALGACRQFIIIQVGLRTGAELALTTCRHLLSLPIRFFESHQIGDLMNRVMDAPKAASSINAAVLGLILDAMLLASCGAVLLWQQPRLALVALAFWPLMAAVSWSSNAIVRRKEREIRERVSALSGRIFETLSHIRTIKAYAFEGAALRTFEGEFHEWQRSTRSRALVSMGLSSLSALLTGAASMALLWVGAGAAIRREITVGDLMFLSSVFGMFVGATDRMTPGLATIQEAAVGLERIRDVQSIQPEDSGCGYRLPEAPPVPRCELRAVSFAYRPEEPVIHGITIAFEAGERVAILGKTGSGKSTLLSLINGFYAPTGGEVLLNQRRVTDIDLTHLRRHVILVSQDASLLSGTVLENIEIGKPGAPLVEVYAAARLAAAHDFISQLPGGYGYTVGPGGAGLSAGQRQRISLARALLRDPSVLILDEATGHLDSQTEAEILDAVRSRKHGITLVATHRISLAARMDRIVVIEQGVIAQTGSHDELISREGYYRTAWRASATGNNRGGDNQNEGW